jgi:hypothetical protein
MAILAVFVLVALVGSLPIWPHSKRWGFGPISGVSVIILVILILFWTGHLATKAAMPHFKTMAMVDVPRSRNGKHKKIVTAILRDLDQLGEGVAFKVPLADLGDSKENVRSALNRATRKSNRGVATATDENFLYVWNAAKPDRSNGNRPNGQGKPPRNNGQA